jgi:hypothetical protein
MPTESYHLFKSRKYATTLINNFNVINTSLNEINNQIELHYKKLTVTHKAIIDKDMRSRSSPI